MRMRQNEIKAGTRILPPFAALLFVVTICGFAFLVGSHAEKFLLMEETLHRTIIYPRLCSIYFKGDYTLNPEP